VEIDSGYGQRELNSRYGQDKVEMDSGYRQQELDGEYMDLGEQDSGYMDMDMDVSHK